MPHNRSLCRRLPAFLLAALIFASLPLHAMPARRPEPVWKFGVLGELALSWVYQVFSLSPENPPSKEGVLIDPDGQPTQEGHDGDEGITIDPNG